MTNRDKVDLINLLIQNFNSDTKLLERSSFFTISKESLHGTRIALVLFKTLTGSNFLNDNTFDKSFFQCKYYSNVPQYKKFSHLKIYSNNTV